MKFIENGEVVLYSTGGELKTNVGMILKHKDNGNYVILSKYNTAYKDINPEWITTLNNVHKTREEVIKKYNDEIAAIQEQIRKVTKEEKEQDRISQYREMQKEIKVVAKRLSESTDDVDFENRLKAISDMKKNLFSIELECVSDIRKQNGKLKYQIRELEKQRDNLLNRITDENIEKAFSF